VHVSLVYEGPGYESTYGGVPSSSFVPGYDPDYAAWYAFELDGVVAPADHAVASGTVPTQTDYEDSGAIDTGGGTVVTGEWEATITVDGDPSDFPPDTSFSSTSGHTVQVAWDADQLYLSVTHPDIATGGDQHWVVVAVGDDEYGAFDGLPLGTQQPAYAYPVDAVLRVKADGSYDALHTYDAGQSVWTEQAGFLGTTGQAAESGDTLEMAIPWASLPVGRQFTLTTRMVYEGAGYESTYNGVPDTAFVEGYDPDVDATLHLDRDATVAPALHGMVK
jgi:hypothetical protein